jgi:hypothetical protein
MIITARQNKIKNYIGLIPMTKWLIKLLITIITITTDIDTKTKPTYRDEIEKDWRLILHDDTVHTIQQVCEILGTVRKKERKSEREEKEWEEKGWERNRERRKRERRRGEREKGWEGVRKSEREEKEGEGERKRERKRGEREK